MEYGKPFPFEEIIKDEKVYILDYSIEPEEMQKLYLEITQDVIWIDHHKTAIDKYSDFLTELYLSGGRINGLRMIEFSGCENTWKFLYPDKDMPLYVELIGERDTWRNPHSPFVRDFHYALGAYDTNPVAKIWENLMKDTGLILKEGNLIYHYVQRQNVEALQQRGFWFEFHGHKTFAINSDIVRSSEFYPEVAPEAEIWIMFRYIPNDKVGSAGYWTVSLYSDKIDVSEIAKQYEYNGKRGGGHKGASGFQIEDLSFLADLV
jgi:oligoribonuclease NrnB/cAMP/cGMP phosphodiesterase (DHH superfamily)